MYTNNKEQISLEEAYRLVHLPEKKEILPKRKKKKPCCDSCSENKKCECENVKESTEVPTSVDDALDSGQQIVLQGDDAASELKEFLPLVFSGAAVSLGIDEQAAKEIANQLMSVLDISSVEDKISSLHAEKERLTDEAKYSMEAQVKLNKVIDDILKQGTYEALDFLYGPVQRITPSGIVKALELEIQKRISSRK